MLARRSWIKSLALVLMCWTTLCLSACSPSRKPLQITDVSISPEPLVGRISTLHIEIISTEDQPEVWFTVNFLQEYNNRVYPVSGTTDWRGPLTANQPQAFDVNICVWEEGSWPIEIRADRTAEGDKYYVFETIQIESSATHGKMIREDEINRRGYISSETTVYTDTNTLEPVISLPECSSDENK